MPVGVWSSLPTNSRVQSNELKTLNAQVVELYPAGKYAAASEVATRALELAEGPLEPDHLCVGTTLNNVAALYRVQDRYAEAEPLHKRNLTI